MNFDELQKTWQQVQNGSKLIIDSDILTEVIKRNKKEFELAIFRRDALEITVGIILFGGYLFFAIKSKDNLLLTSSYVAIAIACLFVSMSFLVDRVLQRRKKPKQTESLFDYINASLIQINHQIYLLKNILWWYMLPISVGLALFFIAFNWGLYKASLPFWVAAIRFSVELLILLLVDWGIYCLNQSVVKKGLKPRKEELENLLNSLSSNDSPVGL